MIVKTISEKVVFIIVKTLTKITTVEIRSQYLKTRKLAVTYIMYCELKSRFFKFNYLNNSQFSCF